MLNGWKVGAGETAKGGGIVAFLVALALALAAVYVASGGWLAASVAPPPGVSAPSF